MNDKGEGESMNDLTRYKMFKGIHTPAAAKLIYCYLLDMSGGRHRSVAVSIKTLASDMGFSRSASGRNLHRLKRLDMIDIAPRYTGDGGRLSNRYTLK
jgi:response regulator of citrate/malate metabolism